MPALLDKSSIQMVSVANMFLLEASCSFCSKGEFLVKKIMSWEGFRREFGLRYL